MPSGITGTCSIERVSLHLTHSNQKLLWRIVDAFTVILILGVLIYITAETVNHFQNNPVPEGEVLSTIIGMSFVLLLALAFFFVPMFIGERLFGEGGGCCGWVLGVFISWRFVRWAESEPVDYNLEDRIAEYKKGQIPLSFSNVTMAVVLYGGLFYIGATISPGTGYLSAAIGGLIGLLTARLIVYKLNKTVLGWMEAEAAKKTEGTDEAPDQSIGTLPAMATVTEFGLEGVTFAEGRIDPGPFRKLFMISENRRVSNGVVIIYIVIFLSFMTSLGATGFFVDYSSLSILEFSMFMLVFVPVMFLVYYIPVYLQDWAMDKKFGTSFRHFWKDEEE